MAKREVFVVTHGHLAGMAWTASSFGLLFGLGLLASGVTPTRLAIAAAVMFVVGAVVWVLAERRQNSTAPPAS